MFVSRGTAILQEGENDGVRERLCTGWGTKRSSSADPMVIFEKVFQEESSIDESGTAKTEEEKSSVNSPHLVQDWRGRNVLLK